MNIPFPIIYPRLIGPGWFDADRPYDEDAELTLLEEANKEWLNSIGSKYMKHPPIEKKKPVQPPAEEAGSDDDDEHVTNDDAEESEESHDVDDEEEIPTSESPQMNNEDESESPEDTTEAADLEVEATLMPHINQSE